MRWDGLAGAGVATTLSIGEHNGIYVDEEKSVARRKMKKKMKKEMKKKMKKKMKKRKKKTMKKRKKKMNKCLTITRMSLTMRSPRQ